MDENAEKLQREIEDALLDWWFGYRPMDYSVKDHMGNPTVNMTDNGRGQHRLAEAAAELAAKRLCGL